MKNKSKSILFSLFALGYLAIFTLPARAADLLPANIQEIFELMGIDGTGTVNFVSSRIETGIYFSLGGVVLISVVYAMLATVKYIRSQGDSGQIEEAQKAIKAIVMGIAAMMFGIVGIVIVFVFFGSRKPEAALFQTCASAPQSQGCNACKGIDEAGNAVQGGLDNQICKDCEAAYAARAKNRNVLIVDEKCLNPINRP